MWQEKDSSLYKKFTFEDFEEAFRFMARVAAVAESRNHHPKWTNEWNTVEIWLSTHSAGNVVTDKDRELAAAIDAVLEDLSGVKTAVSKELATVKLYADGGSRGNPGPSASGYVLMDSSDNILLQQGRYLGVTTNNQAEYKSLKFGLEEAKKLGAKEVEVYMDSMLVINQMKGLYKVKNQELWPIHQAAKELASSFKSITYTHVPRELNKLADAQVNKVLDSEHVKREGV